MAGTFSSSDAKKLIAEHRKLLDGLSKIRAREAECRAAVETAAAELCRKKAMEVLSGIPVEELNRDKRGIRVKTLREAGYETLADVLSVTPLKLNTIEGIGSESAWYIRQVADRLLATAADEVKIRLTVDEKTPETNALVIALAAYYRREEGFLAAAELLDRFSEPVEKAMKELSPGKSVIRWLFASKEKKEKAEHAYTYLHALAREDYGRRAAAVIHRAEQTESSFVVRSRRAGDAADDAWSVFAEDPVGMNRVLEMLVPAQTGAASTGGLPEDLAESVQQQPIHIDGLKCTLRSYQELGVKYALRQGNVLLGDEMGLGKTVQAIAAMVSLRNEGGTHFVVVCPASVLTNWIREITKMSDLTVIKVHGDDKIQAFRQWKDRGGVAVTTYETTPFFQFPADFRFRLLVVDEAHYIKNPEAIRTIQVKRIIGHADRVLFMTGTPLENNVEEMVGLMKMLDPEVAKGVRGMEFLSAAPQFREKVAPVYFRRRRDDVLTELPDLTETKEWCTLLPEEKKIYERDILAGAFMDARRVSWSVKDLSKSSKAIRCRELVAEAAEDGRKVIVFSFFLETLRQVKEMFADRCLGPIDGSVPPERRQQIIDEFDKAPAGAVLAAQIQSGGTGLNIQTASVVIICEPQLKPSTENQAISRAYRMGQTRNVLVYRLLSDDTIDERITELLETKQEIFDEFADRSEAAEETAEISAESLAGLVRKEAQRISGEKAPGAERIES
ncbi:MAG: DEAD/DEAH box helicase [Lachnospiraceae bacterium]|nr:DEAD/DEAH box helicase [Candidatus Hippenecus merdae]